MAVIIDTNYYNHHDHETSQQTCFIMFQIINLY